MSVFKSKIINGINMYEADLVQIDTTMKIGRVNGATILVAQTAVIDSPLSTQVFNFLALLTRRCEIRAGSDLGPLLKAKCIRFEMCIGIVHG
jgi:hypothetical protein